MGKIQNKIMTSERSLYADDDVNFWRKIEEDYESDTKDQFIDEYDATPEGSFSFIEMSLEYANLQKVDMSKSNISHAKMKFSNFNEARFWCSEIASSDFHGSDFKNANVEYAEITNSDFSSTNFKNASLRGSQIIDSDFSDADLRGAKLKNCVFTNTNLNGAIFDESTELPFSQRHAHEVGMELMNSELNDAS